MSRGVNGERAPLTVIGGYLGAGKTTLLNQLLRANDGRRLAVIVNDFGDVDIDRELITARDGDTISLANGCVCCSLTDGLAIVLADLRRRVEDIDHVVIEASGVSDPVRIGSYAQPFGFTLRGHVVLADAEQVRRRAVDTYVGDTVVRQLRGADLLVLTKTDLVDAGLRADVRSWLAEHAPGVPIVEAANGRLPSAVVLGDLEPGEIGGRDDGHPLGYDTWSFVSERPLSRGELEAVLGALPDGVLRAKGVVQLADDPTHRWVVQVVGHRSHVARDRPWGDRDRTTRLMVIGLPGSLGPLDRLLQPH